MCTTESDYPALLSDIGKMRLFLNILGRFAQIKTLFFGYYPKDDSSYRSAVKEFLSFFFESPGLFTTLDTLDFGFLTGGDDDYYDYNDDKAAPGSLMIEKLLDRAIKGLKRSIRNKKPCCAAKTIVFEGDILFP